MWIQNNAEAEMGDRLGLASSITAADAIPYAAAVWTRVSKARFPNRFYKRSRLCDPPMARSSLGAPPHGPHGAGIRACRSINSTATSRSGDAPKKELRLP